MSVRYKTSNESWIMSGGFGYQWVYRLQFTVCDNTCTTAAIPVFLQTSGRAATANPPRTSHTVMLKCNPSKARVMLLGEQRWSESQGSLFHAQALWSVQCLSGSLASIDNHRPGDTPFAGLRNILSKSLMSGLHVLVPSSKIFLTKFRFWLYRCLF